MAPTGHAMRLLEMPAAVRTWLEALMRVLLKYRSVVRPGPLGAELVALSKSVRHLQDLLRDRERASVVVVTRSAELPRLETDRVFDRLRRLKLSAPALVINAQTLAPGSCPVCRATASHEQDERQRFGVRRGRRQDVCVIIQTPLAAPPPRGVRALERWAQHWIR
jgi:arsenite-transporting ATPase